jgi:MFS family permease
MGIQSALGDLGVFIAIASTLFIAETIGWTYPFYIWSIVGIMIIIIGILLTMGIPKTHLKHLTPSKKQTLSKKIKEYKQIIIHLRYFTPMLIISGATWGTTLTYLPLFLDETTPFSLSVIGLIISLWIGTGTLASFFYGNIKAMLGRKNTLLFCYLLMFTMNIILIVNPVVLMVPVIISILGIATFLTFPILFSYISEITHESNEGKTFGFTFTLQLGGGTFLLYISGFLSDVFGIWIPFIFMGLASLIASFSIFSKNNAPLKSTTV